MVNIEPHRPYLVLRHFSGATFRYTSWRDLFRCQDYKLLLWGRLDYRAHGDFLASQHRWVFRDSEEYYVRSRKTIISPFSLRWDDGDPVSVGNKLLDEVAHERARKKRRKAGQFRKKTWKKVLRGRGHSGYKRHLKYWASTVPEEGEPPVRTGAGGSNPIVREYDCPDWRFIDRSWKKQSKRRHQWRTEP